MKDVPEADRWPPLPEPDELDAARIGAALGKVRAKLLAWPLDSRDFMCRIPAPKPEHIAEAVLDELRAQKWKAAIATHLDIGRVIIVEHPLRAGRLGEDHTLTDSVEAVATCLGARLVRRDAIRATTLMWERGRETIAVDVTDEEVEHARADLLGFVLERMPQPAARARRRRTGEPGRVVIGEGLMVDGRTRYDPE